MTRPSTSLLSLAGLCGFLFAQTSLADSVSGQFLLDEQTLSPTSVTSFRVRDRTNPREFATQVMLTTKPMNRDAIMQHFDPNSAAINDEAVIDAGYLSLLVTADGTVGMNAHVGGTQYVDSSAKLLGKPGSLVARCTTNTPERVACTVTTAKAVKSKSGKSWTVDVKFDSAVLLRKAGTLLPKDGGEAGKVFLALYKATQGDDLAKIVEHLAPSKAEQYQLEYSAPAQNLASAKQMFDFDVPKQHKITGGELSDDNTARLEVEGVSPDGSRAVYVVTMERTAGRWGFLHSMWVGQLE